MRLVKSEGAHSLESTGNYKFPSAAFGRMMVTLIKDERCQDTLEEFADKYAEKYDDVRYHTFSAVVLVT